MCSSAHKRSQIIILKIGSQRCFWTSGAHKRSIFKLHLLKMYAWTLAAFYCRLNHINITFVMLCRHNHSRLHLIFSYLWNNFEKSFTKLISKGWSVGQFVPEGSKFQEVSVYQDDQSSIEVRLPFWSFYWEQLSQKLLEIISEMHRCQIQPTVLTKMILLMNFICLFPCLNP